MILNAWLLSAVTTLLTGFGGLSLLQGKPQAPAATMSLSGRVIDQDGGSPIANVRVQLFDTTSGRAVRGTYSNSDGAWAFSQVSAGTYEIGASSAGWLPARYGQKKPERSGTPLLVSDGQTLKDLVIRMFRGGVIAGRVVGHNSQPLVGIVVQAWRTQYSAAGRFLDLSSTANTDDQGRYRIFGLNPGQYLVRAVPLRSATDNVNLEGQPPVEGYVATFFPAWPMPSQAAPLVVSAGKEQAGIDFLLPLVSLVSVRGRLIGPAGPITNGQFRSVDDDGLRYDGDPLSSSVASDGRFVLSNIPTGTMTFQVRAVGRAGNDASPTAADMWAITRTTVGVDGVSDINITMQPGATVNGELKFNGRNAPPDLTGQELRIAVRSAGRTALGQSEILSGRVNQGGRFSIAGVPPGPYYLTTVNLTAPWSVESILRDGRDLSSSAIDVSGEDTSGIVITLTDTPASLSGMLRAPNGTVLTDYTVVAFPADSASRANHTQAVYAVRPNTAGRFTIPRLLPGKYLLAVTDDIEPNAWFDPRVLEQLSAGAAPVTVLAGERKVQDLQAVSR